MNSKPCKVWSRVEVKKTDGSTIKLRFQDLPLSRMEEAFEFTLKYMLRDEVCHKASGVYNNEESKDEYRFILNTIFNKDPPHVTMCCVDDDSEDGGEFAGMSTMILLKKSESYAEMVKQFPVATQEMKSLLETADVLEKATDIRQEFDCHYQGAGVLVHPEYRRLGIAYEFIRIRTLICQEHNVPMTGAWMTSLGTQRASEKNNWKTDAEIKPETVAEKCNITFEDNNVVFKHMYTKVE